MDESNVYSIIAVGISVFLFVAYHVILLYKIHANPAQTVYGLSKSSRRIWVASVMFRKQDILAIQTLRNWIMASSFMASTAMAICFGFVAFLASARVNADGTGSGFVFATDGWFLYKVTRKSIAACRTML
jgi:uncharacterized membrane protein